MPDAKQISVLDQLITVPQPYEEGRTITAIEAKVLNQTFCENVSNNVRDKLRKSIAGEEGAPPIAQALAEANEYASKYEFTMASAGGGARSLSPVEREANKLATAIVIQLLARPSERFPKGRKRKDVEKEAFQSEVARIAATDSVVKMATRNVRDQARLAEQAGAENVDVAA